MKRKMVHESVVEIPALLERRRQELAKMSPAERRAEKERERKSAEIATHRARCVGLLDKLQEIARSVESRRDFAQLLPHGILDELDASIRAVRLRLDQLETGDEAAAAVGVSGRSV
jgi:hypothetical protein